MSTFNKKSIQALANQITNTRDGILRRGVWTTKLAELLADETLVIPESTDSLTIGYRDTDYNISINALALRALFEAAKDDIDFPTLLDLLENDYLSPQQRDSAKILETVVSPAKSVLQPKKVLTAREHQTNCIKLGLAGLTVDTIQELLDVDVHSPKVTKVDLVKVIESFQEAIYPQEKRIANAAIREAEELAAKRFEDLTVAGFTDIQASASGFIAKLDPTLSKTALPALVASGYKLVNSSFDPAEMTIVVSFIEVIEETETKPV